MTCIQTLSVLLSMTALVQSFDFMSAASAGALRVSGDAVLKEQFVTAVAGEGHNYIGP